MAGGGRQQRAMMAKGRKRRAASETARISTMLAMAMAMAMTVTAQEGAECAVGASESTHADCLRVWVGRQGCWVGAEKGWTVIRCSSVSDELEVKIEGSGCLCAATKQTSLLAFVNTVQTSLCSSCSCSANVSLALGAHSLRVVLVDQQGAVLRTRRTLLRIEREVGEAANQVEPSPPALSSFWLFEERANKVLREYVDLHRRILDEQDESVAKRFLVVRSSHGVSNTQIEEVTGLLIAILTRRALILDFSNDSYTGPRPIFEYDWPINVFLDGVAPYLTEHRDFVEMPRIPQEEYGKYGELLACQHWNDSMPDDVILAQTLFGFPTAYLNKHHIDAITKTFGIFAFPILHAFLHRPNEKIQRVVTWRRQELEASVCSVGLQIRWHHLRAYLQGWEREQPDRTVNKFLSCALSLCPADHRTTLFVATDFKNVREVLKSNLLYQSQLAAVADSRNLARSCGKSGVEACSTTQSSTSSEGHAYLAVDGNKKMRWSEGACTHTWDDMHGKGTGDPWWMLDMHSQRSISAIRLWNRADCCFERLQGVNVFAGDSPIPTENFLCAADVEVPAAGDELIWCETSAKYIFVVMPGENRILTICEVEVYESSEVTRSLSKGLLPRVVHLEPDEDIIEGDRIMDGGDHETAIADQTLLSLCNYILVTRESTMGFVAHSSVYKHFFQVSPYEDQCRFFPNSQSGLVQEAARIHDEWPWSAHKFSKLSCVEEANEVALQFHGSILHPV